jgi:putative peptide zinc metalloprotease protein
MRLERLQTQHRGRVYRKERDLPAMQVELELGEVLQEKIAERSLQLEKSILVAPAAGCVVTRDVVSLVGRYVHEGEELLAIGNENQKHLLIAIAQGDIERFEDQDGRSIDVRLQSPTRAPFSCTLTGIEPRASQELPHQALAATNGGPLAVRATEADGSDDPIQLSDPHFTAKLTLSDEQGQSLRAGQLAMVRLHTSRGTLARFFYRGVSNWFQRRMQRK